MDLIGGSIIKATTSHTDESNRLLIIKADKQGYIVFLAFYMPIFLGFAYLNMLKGGLLSPLFLLAALYGGVYYFLSAFKIIIQDGQLIYKAPFSKEKRLLFKSIHTVRMQVGTSTKLRNQAHGIFRLILSSNGQAESNFITINIKVFQKVDIASLLHQIKRDSPNSKFDELSTDLAELNYSALHQKTAKWITSKVHLIVVFILLITLLLALMRNVS